MRFLYNKFPEQLKEILLLVQKVERTMEETNKEACLICLESMNDTNKYMLEPCNHEFHTHCIVQWLRYKNYTCPTCRDGGVQNTEEPPGVLHNIGYYYDNYELYSYQANEIQLYNTFAYASRKARQKNAPKALTKLYNRCKQIQTAYETHRATLNQFTKSDDYKLYKNIKKKLISLRTKQRRGLRRWKRLKRSLIRKFPKNIVVVEESIV